MSNPLPVQSKGANERRRRFRRNYQRWLRPSEYKLLNALWRWRLLTYPLAKIIAFPQISEGNYYSKIRRILREGYIIERDARGLDFQVLQLSKKGFDLIKYDLGELKEKRFQAQSVEHDYLATAFMIGEFVFLQTAPRYFTEQKIICTDESLFPDWVAKPNRHIPDGYSRLDFNDNSVTMAIEVELHVKTLVRYAHQFYHFDFSNSKVDVVFWLCAGRSIVNSICREIPKLKLMRADIHHFVLLSEFEAHGWDAKVENGKFNGRTLREIFQSNCPLTPLEGLAKTWQNGGKEIFFPTRKSPVRIKTSALKPESV